jgi:hypothetical protein
MSRIFEALKNAKREQEVRLQLNAPPEGAVEAPDRRRSRRWSLEVSVFVYGRGADKEPFHQEARAVRVNENGALLLLSFPVRKGQTLLLTNRSTQKEQKCRVVFLAARRTQTVEAGVAFPHTDAGFWRKSAVPEVAPRDPVCDA